MGNYQGLFGGKKPARLRSQEGSAPLPPKEKEKLRESLKKSWLLSRGDYSRYWDKDLKVVSKYNLSSLNLRQKSLVNFDDLVTCASDIRKIYKIDPKVIGKGFFGEVRCAKLPSFPSKIFAVKSIRKEAYGRDLTILSNEVDNLKHLDHPNIIRFYESYQDESRFHIVIEYCSGGDLKHLIDRKSGLDEGVARKFMKQILWAVSYIHSQGICNRDIKADNFLISSKGEDAQLKMVDFGLSTRFKTRKELMMEQTVGTPYYVAPEVLVKCYDERCDYWSVGVLMYYMLSGTYPFDGNSNEALHKSILEAKLKFTDDCWSIVSAPAKDLLRRLLNRDINLRISASEALKHRWFEDTEQLRGTQFSNFIAKQLIENLNQFQAKSTFQKLVTSLMVKMLSELEIRHIRRVFREIDTTHTGVLSPDQLSSFLSSNQHTAVLPLTQVVRELKILPGPDEEVSVITYSEFVVAAIDKEFFLSELKLKDTFRYLDVDGSGVITLKNLMEIASRQGRSLQVRDSQSLFRELRELAGGQFSGEQGISLEKFLHVMGLQNLTRNKILVQNDFKSGLLKKQDLDDQEFESGSDN